MTNEVMRQDIQRETARRNFIRAALLADWAGANAAELQNLQCAAVRQFIEEFNNLGAADTLIKQYGIANEQVGKILHAVFSDPRNSLASRVTGIDSGGRVTTAPIADRIYGHPQMSRYLRLFPELKHYVHVNHTSEFLTLLQRWTLGLGRFPFLIPLRAYDVAKVAIHRHRKIFFTCPNRTCAHRGLPSYVCPKCETGNMQLRPGLSGLLWHTCANLYCKKRLPTMDSRGRNKLRMRCEKCGISLLGKHAGWVPEILVAIVGSPATGKSNYLLMAVHAMSQSDGLATIKGEIDDPAQVQEFEKKWAPLSQGMPSAKTADVSSAFLMYAEVNGAQCQLYLYDAPGEEFSSIQSMSKQQYFGLLEGFLLMVDPERLPSRDGVRELEKVIASAIATASGITGGGKLQQKVAVVISKADCSLVKATLGDIAQKNAPNDKCREALVSWGALNAIQGLEQRFSQVRYFACSPLGRAYDPGNRRPFEGVGVLEPLTWVADTSDALPSSPTKPRRNGVASEKASASDRRALPND